MFPLPCYRRGVSKWIATSKLSLLLLPVRHAQPQNTSAATSFLPPALCRFFFRQLLIEGAQLLDQVLPATGERPPLHRCWECHSFRPLRTASAHAPRKWPPGKRPAAQSYSGSACVPPVVPAPRRGPCREPPPRKALHNRRCDGESRPRFQPWPGQPCAPQKQPS